MCRVVGPGTSPTEEERRAEDDGLGVTFVKVGRCRVLFVTEKVCVETRNAGRVNDWLIMAHLMNWRD